jgi:hypothetical protein
MQDFGLALLIVAVGGFFALHCPLATRRELRDGVARGAHGGAYRRSTQPVGFWMVIAMNLLAALLGLLAVGCGLALAISSASARRPPTPGLAIRDVDADAATARTRQAFRAAFGGGAPAAVTRDGLVFVFIPVTTIDIGGGGIALVSTGILRPAGHPSPGLNAIHYLVRDGGRLRVRGSWFGIAAEGSDGRNATRWGVTRRLSRWPVLYTEGGGVWQGCAVRFATLTELRPTGPVDVAQLIPTYFSNGSGYGPRQGQIVRGVIAAAVPGRSFTVRYDGAMRFRETYVRRGDRYRIAGGGEGRMPGC